MRAFVLTAPRQAQVQEVPEPVAGPGQVVVDVTRVGVCGTDVEFFTGEMAYLHTGQAAYPLRLGHEWCGVVGAVGEGVDPWWLGRRVTGDTMLGCGHCHRCTTGRQHVCEARYEIGVRNGWPGALAEKLPVPVTALHELGAGIDDVAGALVEPGANSLRAAMAAEPEPGKRILIWGSGTIGLLTTQLAVTYGADVTVVGHHITTLELAASMGATTAVLARDFAPDLTGKRGAGFDAVIDATNDREVPALALATVEPGGRVVFIGLAGEPSLIDTRTMALKDVTAVGILSGSPAVGGIIDIYSSGSVDPRPVVAATVGLEQAGEVLAGIRPSGAGPGPKIHIDPRI